MTVLLSKVSVRIEESDMYLHPDLDTWVIFPWTAGQGKVARLICDVYKTDGTPFEGILVQT